MRNMKIRVNEANRQEVKAALLGLGYEETNRMENLPIFDRADAYYTYNDGFVLCTDDDPNRVYFDKHTSEEYVLFAGEFKPLSYFTQPKTPEQKPVEHVPIGLRPRHIALRERNKEILEAIGRYVEAGKVIPREWLNELMQNNEEME